MAVDGYMWFRNYKENNSGAYLTSESQVDTEKNDEVLFKKFFSDAVSKGSPAQPKLFEIEDFSFDIEQTLNIGSQSTGAGAGKVTFNPFSITRKIDRCSPILYESACSGTPFQQVTLGLRKAAGGKSAGQIYL